ncbi:MAG: long-chain-fatty-acid--CoA ligase [Alphaproteobacteria bacterium]
MTTTQHPWVKLYDAGIDPAAEIPYAPVFELLHRTARDFPNRPAMDFLGKKYKWREVESLANGFARGLQQKGLIKGQKVALFLPNSPFFLIAYYGILRAGGTVVNVNPLYAKKEIKHLIADSEADLVVTLDLNQLYAKIRPIMPKTQLKKIIVCRFADALPFPKNLLFPLVKRKDIADVEKASDVLWFHDLVRNDRKPAPVDIDPHNDVAVLQYTGGTTGTPKGAMLTHKNIYSNAVQSLNWFREGARMGEGRMLGVLPFFHVFAMTAIMNFSVAAAFEIIALPQFNLKETLKTIHQKRPHFFPAVPAIFSAINNFSGLKDYDISSLEYCISGGAPLPVEVKKTFEALTGCILVEGYGLTETSPVACVNPLHGKNKAGSIGLPLQQTFLEIINPDDKTTPMPLGERGELCITGPQVMKGYWNKPEETADVLKNGRLHTGDIAVMDEEGYFYIVDRLKDMIITNGYNVYPRNVEEAIYQHPDIEECIVAGLPDSGRGEIVKAWIKLKDGSTLKEGELKAFLGDKISKMQIPRVIEIRAEPLPKTMIGKLSRKDVLEQEKQKKN